MSVKLGLSIWVWATGKQGAEKNVCTEEAGSKRWLENKTGEFDSLYSL